jgi:hypothetical protein
MLKLDVQGYGLRLVKSPAKRKQWSVKMAFKVKEYPSLKLFIHSYKLVKEGCEHVTIKKR